MNIGDGLTIQTRTIDGKPSTGIFLLQNNVAKGKKGKFNYKSKTGKYPLRSRVEPTQQPSQKSVKQPQENPKKKGNFVSRSVEFERNKAENQNKREKNEKQNDAALTYDPKKKESDNENNNNVTRPRNKKPELQTRRGGIENLRGGKKADERKENVNEVGNENINTKFVTLTQGQLNTILSLVKTKHDIDVSEVLTNDKKESNEATSSADESNENKSEKDSNVVEPESVPGLDSDASSISNSRPSSTKSNPKKNDKTVKPESVKDLIKKSTQTKEGKPGIKKTRKKPPVNGKKNKEDDQKAEERDSDEKEKPKEAKLSGYDLCGALGGFGSREQNKSILEDQRQQWIKDLREQVEKKEKLKEEEKQKRRNNSTQALKSASEVVQESREDADPPQVENKSKDKKTAPIRSAPPSAKNPKKKSNKDKVEASRIVKQSQENLPAAIRSSFFMGEAAPREHAFSARKREQQRRWREELDTQRIQQQEKKKEEKRLWMNDDNVDDTDAWANHFDTMIPVKKSLASSLERASMENPPPVADAARHLQPQHPNQNSVPLASAGSLDLIQNVSDSQMDKIMVYDKEAANLLRDPAAASLMTSIYRGEHTTAAPGAGDQQRSSYLRTMTSLLDPAQIEALEVKRRKQDEHRRAIEAQVEERRRKKDEEENRQKRLEMEEDTRLAAERDKVAHKTEIEKMKHQMQENIREQQTKELYHQMQEAQESALRDKLRRREQKLRDKGHDTSRLEKTHQLTLETKRKVTESTTTLTQPSMTSIASSSAVLDVPSLTLPRATVGHNDSITPRQAFVSMDDSSPVSLMAQTDQGPIKLEISFNNRQHRGAMAEAGSQTENTRVGHVNHGRNPRVRNAYDSDAETEYHPLPQPRSKRAKEQRVREEKGPVRKDPRNTLQKYERGLDQQYSKFSRTDRGVQDEQAGDQRPRKNDARKPKWGVGQKNKEFVPASKRYVNNAQWQQKHEANIRRREEQLLEQQALNDPERLRVIAAQMRQQTEQGDIRSARLSPPVPTIAHKMESKSKNPRRTRSHSPLKTGTQGHRSKSPPSRKWQKNEDLSPRRRRGAEVREGNRRKERPESVMSATTEQAKYRPGKHSRDSPVPDTKDFVQYRRTSDVLDPNQPQSRPETGHQELNTGQVSPQRQNQHHNANNRQDPLFNPDMVRQRDRQEQILREISILRQGLLLKQREVASYPAAMTHSMASLPHAGINPTNLLLVGGGNLPERTNDTPLM